MDSHVQYILSPCAHRIWHLIKLLQHKGMPQRQLCRYSTNRLEHAQVRPGTHSFPAKSATLAGHCRPGSVQSLRPGVQMSAQDGSWIPVDLLPTRLRHFWSPPSCDRLTVVISTSHVWNLLRTEGVHLHTPALQTGTRFLLTLETIVFLFHLLSATSKPYSSLSTRLAHAARFGF